MEKEFYKRLLSEHRDRIYSLALYNLRDAEDAADVTQETFLRLWKQEGDWSDRQAKAWLLRVCHNLCIDQVRRRKTVRTHFGTPDTDIVDRLPDEAGLGDDPQENLERQQRRQALLDGMAVLPAETRSIMMLHYFQDLKIQEIAGLLGLNAGTIKVRLHRARKTLLKILGENNGGPLAFKRETG